MITLYVRPCAATKLCLENFYTCKGTLAKKCTPQKCSFFIIAEIKNN